MQFIRVDSQYQFKTAKLLRYAVKEGGNRANGRPSRRDQSVTPAISAPVRAPRSAASERWQNDGKISGQTGRSNAVIPPIQS
jgi:hypothetical protein